MAKQTSWLHELTEGMEVAVVRAVTPFAAVVGEDVYVDTVQTVRKAQFKTHDGHVILFRNGFTADGRYFIVPITEALRDLAAQTAARLADRNHRRNQEFFTHRLFDAVKDFEEKQTALHAQVAAAVLNQRGDYAVRDIDDVLKIDRKVKRMQIATTVYNDWARAQAAAGADLVEVTGEPRYPSFEEAAYCWFLIKAKLIHSLTVGTYWEGNSTNEFSNWVSRIEAKADADLLELMEYTDIGDVELEAAFTKAKALVEDRRPNQS